MNKWWVIGSLAGWLVIMPGRASAAEKSRLDFDPAKTTVNSSGDAQVNIVMDAAKYGVMGVDMVFKYDPKLIEITDIAATNVFDSMTGKKIDNQKGRTMAALSNNYGHFVTGRQTIATLSIQARSGTRSAKVEFEFVNGSTTDSNLVIEHGKDVLNSTGVLTISIPGKILLPTITPTITGLVLGVQTEPTTTDTPKVSVIGDLKLPGAKRKIAINWTWGLLGLGLLGIGAGIGIRRKSSGQGII